ncbi:selenocysteine-specific elongation factor [Streptomyces sp. WMMB 714]|uniref:selenocysteine-specific translation elongation factor n=1 Tax=Streptomyces sp. WMMB 714 TaxID=1286822 RepID=UPI0005F8772B|nr:selenocysteine-specific translation elongation factor [Streptomyces sp. WMMB 714]SCK52821.1 selenocysteine-specific elongation factor [Streptomyces sp. WMMB 714]
MLVVATAGHVDHGKSSLLRALTGSDPDRLDEERRRGLTLDLGFVWTRLPGGAPVAFVDVPGHHRFIANTLAGIATAPSVLFVVAADEGWKPQSGEHLAALDAFGVRTGLLAITRADLADPARALADAREHLAGSGLASIESVAVSARTGAGLDALRQRLDALHASGPPADPAAPVRLWLDRVFTADGAGTVATGTLTAGRLAVGDELELAPRGRPVTVRGLQRLGAATEAVAAPARVAVNLRRTPREAVKRGNALVTPGSWWRTDSVDVRLDADAAALPAEPLVHCGTAMTSARVRPLGRSAARLRLRTPLDLHIGDRLLIRDPGSRLLTGAVVLDVAPPPLARRGAAAARAGRLAAMTASTELPVQLRRLGMARRDELRAMGVRTPDEGAALEPGAVRESGTDTRTVPDPSAVPEPGTSPGSSGGVVAVGDWLVDPGHAAGLRTRLHDAVTAYGAARPLEPGLPVTEAQRELGLPEPALVEALAQGRLRVSEGRLYSQSDRDRLPPAVGEAARALLEDFRAAPFRAPTEGRLKELGLTRGALALLVREGRLARYADVWLPHDAAGLALARLRGLRAPFTVGEACRALETSRRVAVPLLEHLDRSGLTRRDATGRRTVTGD